MANVRDDIKRKDDVEKLIWTIYDGTKRDVNMIQICILRKLWWSVLRCNRNKNNASYEQ